MSFRLVRLDDAGFIVGLRSDKERARYVSLIPGDIGRQEQWIREYKQREAAGLEFYYIIQGAHGQRIGTVRMYDPQGDSWEWGSWVVSSSESPRRALESLLAIYEYAFVVLGLQAPQRLCVVKDNRQVVSANELMGAKLVDSAGDKFRFSVSREDFLKSRERFRKYLVR